MPHIIQNKDVNVGPASYKNLLPDQLLVTSVFYTVQGEGPFAGHPAVFVRLAGCNRGRKEDMGCAFCDTAFQFSRGQVLSFESLETQMVDVWLAVSKSTTPPLVVITGGEPMMQNNLAAFCEFLRSRWEQIQIESNGDRLLPDLPGRDFLTLVVSPKVSKVPGALSDARFAYREPNADVYDRADCFKFLVETEVGTPYGNPPSWARVSGRPVYVSPITHYVRPVADGEVPSIWNHRLVDVPRTRANYKYAAAMALQNGYLISTQQHLLYELA